MLTILRHPLFDTFVIFTILMNIGTMAMDQDDLEIEY
jgi:hypothetical protein